MTVQTPDRPGLEIEVSPEMERAGLEELFDVGISDPAYLVRSIYRAMAYVALDVRGKL